MSPRAPKICPAGHKFTGRKCPECWPAWEGSNRQSDTNTAGWKRLRLQCLQRDNYQCQLGYEDRCISVADNADHIVPKYQFARPEEADTLSNLQSACGPCHRKRSAQQGAAEAAVSRRAGDRVGRDHQPRQQSPRSTKAPVEDWSPSVIRVRRP